MKALHASRAKPWRRHISHPEVLVIADCTLRHVRMEAPDRLPENEAASWAYRAGLLAFTIKTDHEKRS